MKFFVNTAGHTYKPEDRIRLESIGFTFKPLSDWELNHPFMRTLPDIMHRADDKSIEIEIPDLNSLLELANKFQTALIIDFKPVESTWHITIYDDNIE